MRLFGVAYVVTAALAVYRMVKDMRTYYTARRSHATTRKKAIYSFESILLSILEMRPLNWRVLSKKRYRRLIYSEQAHPV